MKLAGKTIIVTGGASGIGEAISRRFLLEGANVVIGSLPKEAAAQTLYEGFLEQGLPVALVEGDLSKPQTAQALFESAQNRFGRVDILVSNAAAFDGYRPLLETDEAVWQKVIDVNVTGNFYLTHTLLPHMIENGGGVVIFIASIAGLIAGHGGAAYTSSKHAVVGLAKHITFHYGKEGIRCNTICPGSVYTPLSGPFLETPAAKEKLAKTPYGTYGLPEDIAHTALFLASDEARFMHGATLVVDGGNMVRKWD